MFPFFPVAKMAIERMNGSLNRNQITIDLMLDACYFRLLLFIRNETLSLLCNIIIYQWSFANHSSNQTSKSLIWIIFFFAFGIRHSASSNAKTSA